MAKSIMNDDTTIFNGDNIESMETEKHQKDVRADEIASTATLMIIVPVLLLSMFLVALDKTIIGTAIPRITDDFNSLNDVGWYGSAYMLANCSTQLLFGRIYKFHNNKSVFLLAIALFEIGSAICGAAPTSAALIVGRAIAGAGASGIFSGAVLIITQIIPLHKRPVYVGAFGGVFAIASIVGPLLGGAFTEKLSWRWCFYINLPFAAVAILVILLFLKVQKPMQADTSLSDQVKQLDPLGTIILVGCIVCLILALQWGGSTYTWSDGRVIALLVLFGVLFLAFIAIQLWKKDQATVPPRIISQRSIAAGFLFAFCGSAAMMILAFMLPIWFQAVKGVDPLQSGIMTIPMILSMTVASLMAGAFTQRIGYYVPTMILSPILSSIGAGLMTTFTITTAHPEWIGYQVLYGFGLGMAMQQPSLAAQATLSKEDMSIGISLMFFAQQLGGAVFLAIGETVFLNELVKSLSGMTSIDARSLTRIGATELRAMVSPAVLPTILKGYNYALTRTWYVAVAVLCAQLFSALAMEWRSIKKDKKPKEAPQVDA